MDDKYKAELKDRRERHRIAQKSFRKRQSQLKQGLEAENSKLREAIEAIARASSSSSALSLSHVPSELRETIQNAVKVAGVDIQLPSPDSDTSEPLTNPGNTLSVSSSSSSSVAVLLPPRMRRARRRLPYPFTTAWQTPRLIPDPFHYLAIHSAPADMLPFLGNGAYSFAGRIFWAVLERTFDRAEELNILAAITVADEPLVHFKPHAGYHRIAERLDPETQRRMTYLSAMYEAQVLDDQDQTSSSMDSSYLLEQAYQSPDEDDDDNNNDNLASSSQWYRQLIEREALLYPKMGHSSLLMAVDVERRVRQVVGEEIFAVMATAAIQSMGKQAKQGSKKGEAVKRVEALMVKLSDTFVCFGDGPRWEVRILDDVLRSWISSIANE